LSENKAIQAEQGARKEMEDRLLAELETRQEAHLRLQAEFSRIQGEFEHQLQHHTGQINELSRARDEAQANLEERQEETDELLQHVATLRADRDKALESHRSSQTELERARDVAVTKLATANRELEELQSQIVQLQTEMTVVKAELDGAYGTRAQRAADVSTIKNELDVLKAHNEQLEQQLEHVKGEHAVKASESAELHSRVNGLQQELKDIIEDYEVMIKASIESEKERDRLEASIDSLRDRSEVLEAQLSDEKVKWFGIKDKVPTETTSMMVLKNEFKKMMRDTRAESIKALRAEQEERRRLEGLLRSLKRDRRPQTPSRGQARSTNTTEPVTPA